MKEIDMKVYEISLKKYFLILWSRKIFISIVTLFVTLLSIIYTTIFPPQKIYKGTLLLEIGEIKTENELILIDHPKDLKYIIKSFTDKDINVDIPRQTNKLLIIEVRNPSKQEIKNSIEEIYLYLREREDRKLKGYDNYIQTLKVGNINISSKPINKMKQQVMISFSFLLGLILSILYILISSFYSKDFCEL